MVSTLKDTAGNNKNLPASKPVWLDTTGPSDRVKTNTSTNKSTTTATAAAAAVASASATASASVAATEAAIAAGLSKPASNAVSKPPDIMCHPEGSTGRTETVKGGPLGIRVISKNKIIYVNNVEENSKLKQKVAVGDRITHINGNVIWDMKPSAFAQLLVESTKRINGEDQVCRLTLQSPSQVKAQVQKMQQMQIQTTQNIETVQRESLVSAVANAVAVTPQESGTMSMFLNTKSPSPKVTFNLNGNRPYSAIASGLRNSMVMNNDGENAILTAYKQLTPPTPKLSQTELNEKILFAGHPDRKFRFILVALATACQEIILQNKWMHVKEWVKIIDDNYDFPTILHFTADELVAAIRSNHILKQDMERSENLCGMFFTTYTHTDKPELSGSYISSSPIPSQTASLFGSVKHRGKRNIMAKSPRRTVRECLDGPVIHPSKLRFLVKKTLPLNLVQRALAIEECRKEPQRPDLLSQRKKMIDPLCDALRNGPPLPKGASVYWDSLEARKYFGASKDETSLDAIDRSIKILRKALSTHDGYQDISELEGGLEISAEQVYDVRIQIQAVMTVLVVALDKMPELGIIKCCEEAVKRLSQYYDRTWTGVKLKQWLNEFRQTGKFLVKQKKQKKAKKRKRTSDTDIDAILNGENEA